MEIVVIFNGIGNQMSQYAFYLSKKTHNKSIKVIFSPCSKNEHNGSELDKIFGIKYDNSILARLLGLLYKQYNSIPKIRRYLHHLGIRVIREPQNYDYCEKYLKHSFSGLCFYVGGWHSEKYFVHLRTEILNTFKFNIQNEDTKFKLIYQSIEKDERSVSLHIRRGDYMNHPEFGEIASIDYYNKAILYIKNKIPDANFYCFSNDIEWCRQQLPKNICYVDINQNEKSWRDLCLMSICHHHIIANSTFSWWGAWLSEYTDSINICPDQFIKHYITKDVYPEKWIKIKS